MNMKILAFVRTLFLTFILVFLASCSRSGEKLVRILETTDTHGMILPYDFTEQKKSDASLASVNTYVSRMRKEKIPLVLLDNGDNLQGQPTVYYYNFIDTVSPHLLASAMNYMKYDAATAGNHDIETGHSVYDRLVREYDFPVLAANAVDVKTGKPYFEPYRIIEKEGLKIAVFGLITPAVPTWLPPELYSGIEFRDMVETAKAWMPKILAEKPDVVVGLFHSGWDRDGYRNNDNQGLNENGSSSVAYNVPGFDIIFNGHDHRIANENFVNSAGDTVLILDGGSRAEKIACAEVRISNRKIKGRRKVSASGTIVNVADLEPDAGFMNEFSSQNDIVRKYVERVIGTSSAEMSSRDAYFGPSSFMGMIHSIQLEITGADISFAAPLSFDVTIPEGPIKVGDMFKLYRFENMLYTISMTGEEIRKYLEYSYGEWLDTPAGPDDNLLLLRTDREGSVQLNNGKAWLRNQPYNFDSADGINYTVDITKPVGQRIKITGFIDGRPFEENKTYRVAVNSYRGNGGGGHLTEGAGIVKEELPKRLLRSTDRDLRYFILRSIEEKKNINPVFHKNWKIIPESLVSRIMPKDRLLLFGKE